MSSECLSSVTLRTGDCRGQTRAAVCSDLDEPRGLTVPRCDVHNACMAVKTISLKLEAYERLRAARRYPTESFSEVVMRATWPEDTITAGELLHLARASGPRFSDEVLDRIEALKRRDQPPEDQWTRP